MGVNRATGEISRGRAGDLPTYDTGDRTRIPLVRSKCVNTVLPDHPKGVGMNDVEITLCTRVQMIRGYNNQPHGNMPCTSNTNQLNDLLCIPGLV